MTLPRRTLQEVLTVFSVPPHGNFLFVEGAFDVVFYRKQLERMGIRAELLTSDYTDVPADDVRAIGLIGNKGRLLALGEKFAQQPPQLVERVAIVVDRDLEAVNPVATTWAKTFRTDFVEVEHYATIFSEVLHALHLIEGEAVDQLFIDDVTSACLEMFKIRAWLEVIEAQERPPEAGRSLILDGTRIRLDTDHYFERLSSKIGREIATAEFTEWWATRSLAPTSLRDQSKVADFVSIVFDGVKLRFGSRKTRYEPELRAWIRGALTASSIEPTSLGNSLRSVFPQQV